MAWVFLVVSLAVAILAVNALWPVRREPLSAVSYLLGCIVAELPLQAGALASAAALVFALEGGLAGWPGWSALAMVAASWAGWIRLTVDAHRAGRVVADAMASGTGGVPAALDFDPVPAWSRWWRLVIAVPFRFRGITRLKNIDYWGDGLHRHRLDVLTRRRVRAERAPVLVSIHGGGWMFGDKRTQGIPLMHELVQRGWVCVAVNYRLSPKGTWPDHVVDCKRAVAWVHRHIAEYGGDPGFVAVTGGSAGGQLAALVALTPHDPEWQPGFEELDTSVAACLPFYGVYDMTGRPDGSGAYGDGMVRMLERVVMKVRQKDDPALFERASPDRRVTSSAPPTFVFHGTNDTLVSPTVGRSFAERLRAAGVPVAYAELPSAQHAFEVLASIRSRHTTMGAVRFLEGVRARSAGDRGPVAGDLVFRPVPRPEGWTRGTVSDVESHPFLT